MTIHPQAKQVAWHVGYEIWIFSEGVRSYNPGIRGSQRFQHNLILESILVHARVIYEFLFIKPKRPDDVRAEDVFDDPIRWSPNKSELCPFLAENLVRLNRSLQHLSFGRLKFSPNLWDVQAIARETKNSWTYFLGQLPEERKEWFQWALEGQRMDNHNWFLEKIRPRLT